MSTTKKKAKKPKEPETCNRCQGEGWVCENHPFKPWRDGEGCDCGGAGEPCVCRPIIPPWSYVPEGNA